MRKIEVSILDQANNPLDMMMFLARLTQRGEKITCMDDLIKLYNRGAPSISTCVDIARLPHGTIKRFTPITIAVVGASRRFLSQIRTHSIGLNFVSGSLQYSDYSSKAMFTVPFSIEKDAKAKQAYEESCANSLAAYEYLVDRVGNDAAGYAMPQGLRNVLVIQGNHEAWANLIRSRSCNRNTEETQFVMFKIWDALLKSHSGKILFEHAGPDCLYGICREREMSCRKPITTIYPEEWLNDIYN